MLGDLPAIRKFQGARMARTLVGVILGLLIGAGCRWLNIPLPSPPKLLGALLVVAMTIGYIGIDKLLAVRSDTTTKSTSNSVRAAGPRSG
jgi:XapX domain-containing protein